MSHKTWLFSRTSARFSNPAQRQHNCIRKTQPSTSPLLMAVQVSIIFPTLMDSDFAHFVYSPSYIPFHFHYFYFYTWSVAGQLNLGYSFLVLFPLFNFLLCYIKCDCSNHGSLTNWSDPLSSYRYVIYTSHAA